MGTFLFRYKKRFLSRLYAIISDIKISQFTQKAKLSTFDRFQRAWQFKCNLLYLLQNIKESVSSILKLR